MTLGRTDKDVEAAVAVLAEACRRVEAKNLDAVGTLLDAIFYLRAGHYPSIGRQGYGRMEA